MQRCKEVGGACAPLKGPHRSAMKPGNVRPRTAPALRMGICERGGRSETGAVRMSGDVNTHGVYRQVLVHAMQVRKELEVEDCPMRPLGRCGPTRYEMRTWEEEAPEDEHGARDADPEGPVFEDGLGVEGLAAVGPQLARREARLHDEIGDEDEGEVEEAGGPVCRVGFRVLIGG